MLGRRYDIIERGDSDMTNVRRSLYRAAKSYRASRVTILREDGRKEVLVGYVVYGSPRSKTFDVFTKGDARYAVPADHVVSVDLFTEQQQAVFDVYSLVSHKLRAAR